MQGRSRGPLGTDWHESRERLSLRTLANAAKEGGEEALTRARDGGRGWRVVFGLGVVRGGGRR